MQKYKEYYAKTSASIPGIRIWEHVIMFFAMTVGIRGFLGESIAFLALGPYAPIYWIIMLIAPIIFELGQFMKPPNGLVVSMAAAFAISGVSFAVYGGLAVVMGTLLFSGYAALLVFAFGGLLRSIQMFIQLNRLQIATTQIRKEHNDYRDTNSSSGFNSD